MSNPAEWRRRCPNSGCRYTVIYPGETCPACGIATVPAPDPEPLLPHQVPALEPCRVQVLDVPDIYVPLPVRRIKHRAA